MTGQTVRVLLVEDSIVDAELIVREISRSGMEFISERVDSLGALHQALQVFKPDIVLSDYSIPGFGGMQALDVMQQQRPDVPFIFVSGTIGEERAIEALLRGATDYVLKDNRARLVPAIRRALKEATERRALREAERARDESERRFRLFMDHLPAAVFMRDASGRLAYVNSEFERLAAMSNTPSFSTAMPSSIPAPSITELLSASEESVLTLNHCVSALQEISVAGSQRFFLVQKFPIPSENAETDAMLGGIAMDVTSAYYDALTGLANRQLFFDRLAQLLEVAHAEATRVAIVTVDLQKFRNINDMLGRRAGDDVLRQCAAVLRTALGSASHTLARLDGDRFAAAISLQDMEWGALAQTWINQLQFLSVNNDDVDLHIALKIGIALYPNDGNSADVLFRNAEAALQRAKETEQHCVFYSPEMNARIAEGLLFESRLHRAVEQHQFQLYYQPKVDLRTRRMCGVEALIRWIDPVHGMISPIEFIPLLEQSGMIIDVGGWIFEQAMRDIHRWRNAGFVAPRVAVNVSQVQLRQSDFVERVLSSINYVSGMEIPCDIEITESLFMHDSDASIAKLRRLREAGMKIFIDDFGTGYSSLSQIMALPLDALKIDRSFITNMKQDMTLVSTIISLAHALQIDVVAEGVETEDQAAILTALRCSQAQGYLTGRPVPADMIETLLQRIS